LIKLNNFSGYLSSLTNTKIVAQCSAQLYSFLTYIGSRIEDITCVGHSLGAHICGMMSNHLTKKQHRIIGKFSYQVHVQVKILAEKVVLRVQ
jgi:pancreatic lipase-related protein 2